MSLVDLSAQQLSDGLAEQQFSSADIAQACLQQIDRHDGQVGAFLQVDHQEVLRQAEQSDQRRSTGRSLGPLDGIPIALKDIICTAGWRTTCASKMLADFVPPYDATVVTRLRNAGLVLIGKTNLDEFAMGGSTENSALGTTRNPWDLQCVPGGSSGGSAAAVAARMAPLALGTDTGGSIRQPAAYCGIVGMKPTYGRVSRYGLVAFASSLDQIGPMARSARDTALLLEVIAGHDPSDATSAGRPTPAYASKLDTPLGGLRLGVVAQHFREGMNPEIESSIRSAVEVFRSLGASVTELELPHADYAIATYYVIAPCEASSNLARYDGVHYGYRTDETRLGRVQTERQDTESDQSESLLVQMYRRTRAEGFGWEVKRRVMLGTYALSAGYYDAYYLTASKVRRLIRNDYDAAFQQVDLLIGPTTPSGAFRMGEKLHDPLSMYLEDYFTVSANLTGMAAMSIPCGQTASGLPIGVQLQAPPFEETRLLRAAHAFQQQTDWHTRKPELP